MVIWCSTHRWRNWMKIDWIPVVRFSIEDLISWRMHNRVTDAHNWGDDSLNIFGNDISSQWFFGNKISSRLFFGNKISSPWFFGNKISNRLFFNTDQLLEAIDPFSVLLVHLRLSSKLSLISATLLFEFRQVYFTVLVNSCLTIEHLIIIVDILLDAFMGNDPFPLILTENSSTLLTERAHR